MKWPPHSARILAIDPCSKGFGFAVLEGADNLVDWGVARVWSKSDDEFVARVKTVVDRYRPGLLVMETPPSDPRRDRTARRIRALVAHEAELGIVLAHLPAARARKSLGLSDMTKHEVASALCDRFPELLAWLPGPRRPWATEDDRMHIFDALLLTLSVIQGRVSAAGRIKSSQDLRALE
jgi:hypothetical protein